VPGALGKAQFALGKKWAGKGVFAECPTLGKVGTEKNPKKWDFFNRWRPPPASARPSPAFFA